ncbi:hypothetical protein, partial [Corynebacterium sp. TAE3-ERU2]|uniref:hypothetical protein n=1 Tax=Corynebacterium sp. TAE3-ERU2 TaxID=2849497 RepID=UPI001C46E30C
MRPNKPQSQGHLIHTQPNTHTTTKAAHINKTKLAHYRVLKQHPHTIKHHTQAVPSSSVSKA